MQIHMTFQYSTHYSLDLIVHTTTEMITTWGVSTNFFIFLHSAVEAVTTLCLYTSITAEIIKWNSYQRVLHCKRYEECEFQTLGHWRKKIALRPHVVVTMVANEWRDSGCDQPTSHFMLIHRFKLPSNSFCAGMSTNVSHCGADLSKCICRTFIANPVVAALHYS